MQDTEAMTLGTTVKYHGMMATVRGRYFLNGRWIYELFIPDRPAHMRTVQEIPHTAPTLEFVAHPAVAQ